MLSVFLINSSYIFAIQEDFADIIHLTSTFNMIKLCRMLTLYIRMRCFSNFMQIICKYVCLSFFVGAQSAWDMLQEEEVLVRITTSCADLDNILGGGISCKEVNEIVSLSLIYFCAHF